jgi:hypothetical protein
MQVGDIVKYRNTGTVGKVLDIEEDGKVTWVHLDTTDLLYDATTIDPAKPDEYRGVAEREKGLTEQLEEVDRLRKQIADAAEQTARSSLGGAG